MTEARKNSIDFALVENGATAGRFIATFWQPIALSRDIGVGRAKRIKMIGEHYTLFRGEDGTINLVQDRCPHRSTSLAYGTVEGNCIRCCYHGWKFDGADGHGVEFPAETEAYERAISLRTYPVREYLDTIFAYFGEGDAPEFPTYPELENEEDGELLVQAVVLPYNYFQRIENDHDAVHVAFTHPQFATAYGLVGVPKVLSAKETEFGLRSLSVLPGGRTLGGFGFMPNVLCATVPVQHDKAKLSVHLAWRVPIDNTSTYSVMINRISSFDEGMRDKSVAAEDPSVIARRVLDGEMHISEIDHSHPLLPIIQDTVSMLGQGVIVDRSQEHLGRSDLVIGMLRRLWMREMTALEEGKPLKKWRRPEGFDFMAAKDEAQREYDALQTA